ncbi:MAG: AAA family ATPase [Actinoplanes sp.]
MNPTPLARHANPLRGRHQELSRITGRLTRLTGGSGSILVVTGPPGSGKSRLLHETALAAADTGHRVVRVTGDPDAALVPGGSLLRGLLAGPGPILDSDRLRELVAQPERRYWVLEEIQESLERTALRQPVVIVVDDLHWCDDLTMLAMRTLPERLAAHAVMWVFAGRSGDDSPGYSSTLARLEADGAGVVALDRLTDEAAAQMAADLLGVAPPADLLAMARGAGNRPLLIRELMLGVREEGVFPPAADVPARFRALVQRRLARLTPDARSVLEVASVLSRRLLVPCLADLLRRPPAALLAPLNEAIAEDLLFEEDGDLRFRHDLVREAVRSTVPASIRRALRREAAGVAGRGGGSVVEVAALMADSAEPGDQDAIAALRAAAAELADGAPSSAADLSRQALALTPAGTPLHREVAAEAVRLLGLAGRPHEATTLGHELLADDVGPETEAAVRLGIAAVAGQFSFAEAVRQCEVAAALPGLTVAARAPLLALMAVNLAMAGDFDRADRVLADGLAAAAEAKDEAARAMCVATKSVSALYHHRWQAAVDLADEAVAISDGVGADDTLWGSAQWRGWLSALAGRPDLALAHAEEGLRIAQRAGQAWLLRQWSMDRCRQLYDAGRLDDARAEAEGVLALADELGPGNYADCTALMTLTRIALHTGDLVAARRYDAEAERMRADEAPIVRRSGRWLGALVATAHRRDPTRIRELLSEAAAGLGATGPLLGAPVDPADEVAFVRLARSIGEHGWAERAVAVAEHRSVANPAFGFLAAVAGHARGLVTGDTARLAEAVAAYREFPRPLPLAAALEDLAAATTEPAEAVACHEEALAVYEATGATRDAARVRGSLRRLGVRRRPPIAAEQPADRWSQLSATERAVVGRVAAGATNREVAAAMFLSPHTVNTHLRHAFAKLDINSRVELTRLALQREAA